METYAIHLVRPDDLYLFISVLVLLLIISPGLIPVFLKKRELSASKKRFFVIGSIIIGLLAMYIISIPYTKKIELNQNGLSIAAFPYSISVSYANIEFETLKVEDKFSTESFQRKNGISLGGFLCGWFWNEKEDIKKGEAFIYLTHLNGVISFQTKNNISILLSPENPNDFIKQMKIKAHEKSN